MGWQKYNIDELLKVTEDLPVLSQQVVATEQYLQKILPIKIQTAIYGNCKHLVTKDKELKLDLLEYQEQVYEELLLSKDKDEDFDKTEYVIPSW